jgi:hypothetical protein
MNSENMNKNVKQKTEYELPQLEDFSEREQNKKGNFVEDGKYRRKKWKAYVNRRKIERY